MKEQIKLEPSPCWGQVLYEFKPQEPTEVGVNQGEKVTIHNEVRGWLFVETKAGQFGYIPLKFCTVNGTAPRRDPMELKVRLSKQGRTIKGVNDGTKCLIDNQVKLTSGVGKSLNTANSNKNADKAWCKEQLDNAMGTDLLKHAIATPLLVAYARKSVINKDYCVSGEQGKTNQGCNLMDTVSPPIPDIGSEHSETSESLSSLEETSSVNSSQPDSVRSDDVMDSTPAAFLPVMLIKNPDLILPDDSTTDSGFSMDEDNEFSDSERYKQILKRKAVDVIFKQNLNDVRKPSNYRIGLQPGLGTKMPRQTPQSETCDHNRVSNKTGASTCHSEPVNIKVRPIVPPKNISLNHRISVKHSEETPPQLTPVSNSNTSLGEKVIQRIPVVPKPTNTAEIRPQGSTFLSRFAVRRSSKDNILDKGKPAPPVARKPDCRRKQESLTLSRIAARGLPRSKENLLETIEKPHQTSSTLLRHPSLRSGKSESRGSRECLLDTDNSSGNMTVQAKVHIPPCVSDRVPAFGHEVKGCLRLSDNGSKYSSSSVGRRKWGSMECLLDRNSGYSSDGVLEGPQKNRAGSVECLLDTKTASHCSDDRGEKRLDINRLASNSQFISIQTSTPNAGLVRSSQVLHSFRTWLDTEETGNQGCQTFSCETENNVNKNGAISSFLGSSNESQSQTMSTFGHDRTRTAASSFKSVDSISVGANVKSDPNGCVDRMLSSASEHTCSDDKSAEDAKEPDTNFTSGAISGTSLNNSEHVGAKSKTCNKVSDFESPELQKLDSKTSAYLNADVLIDTVNSTSLISKLNKNRDNHVKLRRVKSMKETSSRKIEKRRVDWGPCVQIHFYDPESEISSTSSEDHVCRTTAMNFANTLEYEGSLV